MKTHRVPQPFFIKITHKYKYIPHYSLFLSRTTHTSPRESFIPNPQLQGIQCFQSPPTPPLILFLYKPHKAHIDPKEIKPLS
jgi:hypothetical protein